jgi:hypothetical protein
MIWNGTVAGHRLADGRYLLSLIGTAGDTTYYNPVTAFRASALSAYGVTIDTVAPTVSSSAASDSPAVTGRGRPTHRPGLAVRPGRLEPGPSVSPR